MHMKKHLLKEINSLKESPYLKELVLDFRLKNILLHRKKKNIYLTPKKQNGIRTSYIYVRPRLHLLGQPLEVHLPYNNVNVNALTRRKNYVAKIQEIHPGHIL